MDEKNQKTVTKQDKIQVTVENEEDSPSREIKKEDEEPKTRKKRNIADCPSRELVGPDGKKAETF